MDDIALVVYRDLVMSEPSSWPLSQSALRVSVAEPIVSELCQNVLTRSCYATAIGYYPKAKSHEMKRTEHDDYILIYCAEGKGHLSYQPPTSLQPLGVTKRIQQDVKAGELFILPPNTVHAYEADNINPWTVYWCHFQGEQAKDFFDYVYQNQTLAIIRNMTDIDFIQSFRELVDTVRDSTHLSDFIHAANLLRHILTKIERQNKHKNRHENGLPITKIHQFMRANINKQVHLAELATLSHCSKYHFARQYQRLTGSSPVSDFIKLKMEHACFLLEQTSLSMSEIASQLGYDDALYFSRVFRKVLGEAPSIYRKNLLGKSE